MAQKKQWVLKKSVRKNKNAVSGTAEKKRREEEVRAYVREFLAQLPHTPEDEDKTDKIARFVFRKRKLPVGQSRILAAAILWVYERVNFLREKDGAWNQEGIAKVGNAGKSTVGKKAAEIMKMLDIDMLDQRFARAEMADKHPMMHMKVHPESGYIFSDDDKKFSGVFGFPLMRKKEDYYYDAMEHLNEGNLNGAERLLKKAVDIDEHYVAAYVGLTEVYRFKENEKKRRECVERGFEETLRVFPKWPKQMEWGYMENREYMRAIAEKGMLHADNGDNAEAEKWYRLLLKLNPGDNQGIRYLIAGLFENISGEEIDEMTEEGNKKQDWSKLEDLVARQNAKHKFWNPPREE